MKTFLLALLLLFSGNAICGPKYGGGGANGVPDIAAEYIIRRDYFYKFAEACGHWEMRQGNFIIAFTHYQQALCLLPEAPLTAPRRRSYQFKRMLAATLCGQQFCSVVIPTGKAYHQALYPGVRSFDRQPQSYHYFLEQYFNETPEGTRQ